MPTTPNWRISHTDSRQSHWAPMDMSSLQSSHSYCRPEMKCRRNALSSSMMLSLHSIRKDICAFTSDHIMSLASRPTCSISVWLSAQPTLGVSLLTSSQCFLWWNANDRSSTSDGANTSPMLTFYIYWSLSSLHVKQPSVMLLSLPSMFPHTMYSDAKWTPPAVSLEGSGNALDSCGTDGWINSVRIPLVLMLKNGGTWLVACHLVTDAVPKQHYDPHQLHRVDDDNNKWKYL